MGEGGNLRSHGLAFQANGKLSSGIPEEILQYCLYKLSSGDAAELEMNDSDAENVSSPMAWCCVNRETH